MASSNQPVPGGSEEQNKGLFEQVASDNDKNELQLYSLPPEDNAITQDNLLQSISAISSQVADILGISAGSNVSLLAGDGSDGTVVISTPTTLTRDMYYNYLTVNSTLTTDGYRIFVRYILSGNGSITWGTANNGGNGQTHSGGGDATGGTAGAQSGSGDLKNIAGKVGGKGGGSTSGQAGGTDGSAANPSPGSSGLTGGNGGNDSASNGGAGGTATAPHIKIGANIYNTLDFVDLNGTATYSALVQQAGSGSAGGGGGLGSTSRGGGGGGSGATGGTVLIVANKWNGSFTITATGGNGGNGGNGVLNTATKAGGGGGGSGGNGGIVIVIYGTKKWTGVYNLTGGTAGTKGADAGVASTFPSTNGTAGATGTSYGLGV